MIICYIRKKPKAATVAFECSLYRFFEQLYKIGFPGPIYLIKKARPTNSDLAVDMQLHLKGSETPKCHGIGPNFCFREHYILEHY